MTSKELNTIVKRSLKCIIDELDEDETAYIMEGKKHIPKYNWYKISLQTILNTIKEEE